MALDARSLPADKQVGGNGVDFVKILNSWKYRYHFSITDIQNVLGYETRSQVTGSLTQMEEGGNSPTFLRVFKQRIDNFFSMVNEKAKIELPKNEKDEFTAVLDRTIAALGDPDAKRHPRISRGANNGRFGPI
jgi:hypothetical protein